MTSNHEYRDFVPKFMRLLFEPGEEVRIAEISGHYIHNERLDRDTAIDRLLGLETTPNIYFAPSAMGNGSGFTQTNCLYTRAVCLDVDVGTQGHKEASFFDDLEAAFACVMTAPLKPTCVWATGHGLQVMYRLSEPRVFRPAHDPAARIAGFSTTTRKLAGMLQADAAFTPEHLYRVPLSINAKPGIPAVWGGVLHWDADTVHSWLDIVHTCSPYDLPPQVFEHIPVPSSDDERITIPYADLPIDLRIDIENRHPDKSRAWQRLIGQMWRNGYAEDVIWDAMRTHFQFPERYAGRLAAEFQRSLTKIRGQARAYADTYVPLEPPNDTQSVALDTCSALSPKMADMLEHYGRTAGIEITDRLRMSAGFHEHLFARQASGVMESPCGYGKSTWALSHIAVHACEDNPYLYVADTLTALHSAADMLVALNPGLPVGRYHGFDAKRCHALCGGHHDWKVCSPTNDNRVCKTCEARQHCDFYNREQQFKKPAVVMCHNGLIGLLESRPDVLDNRNIIVDEDLNAFLTAEFSLADLQLVRQYLQRIDPDLGALLPYTRFSMAGSVALKQGCSSFAALNYVFRNEEQTAALQPIVAALRKGLGAGFLDPFTHSMAEIDHAHNVLLEVLNFFRTTARGDSCYAYREIVKAKDVSYVCKKSRFSFGAGLPGRRLWILNASAELSTTPYPDELTVYKCPDLQPNSPLVVLHVIQGNPMRSKRGTHVETATRIIQEICGANGRPAGLQHKSVFVATDRKATGLNDVQDSIRAALGADVAITTLARGSIRGSNEAGNCTLACLAAMSFFTTIDDVALSTALSLRRTFPISHVFNKGGAPSMPGGRFKVPAMREHFTLSALDEMYQTIYRGAVRNDRVTEAIVVMPDAEWVSLLWRTVMPGFRFNAVYTPTESGLKIDAAMTGLLGLMMEAPGEEIEKDAISRRLGYSKNTGWKDRKNRARMRVLLEPFFEPGSTNRKLRRRRVNGIRLCDDSDFDAMLAVINDAAQAYKGVIPEDCWHQPYMPADELREAIDEGLEFWGIEHGGELAGVMGLQQVQDVTLIRHAYVLTRCRRQGLGSRLLGFLHSQAVTPCLVGTWATASWAIEFFEKHGFQLVTPDEKDRLLPLYWGVPQRQVETSVVLGDARWVQKQKHND